MLLTTIADGVGNTFRVPIGTVNTVQVNGGGAAFTQAVPGTVVITTPPTVGQVVTIDVTPAFNAPVVTGSKAANAALTSLMTSLASRGLVTYSTS